MTFVYTRRESFVMPMNITEFCSKLPTRISSAATARIA
ncbi:response regulatory protein ypdB [Klebsiella pneumoniae]|uniref:Response regulatory protein ypdB n=1 Tax=Klebsiella pneumoniae TaxID=573 RepID=A0A377V773_KLEPN|nr:response regulatory protein ypdB [Klebsiella pneumoniae]